jgi:polysaccharide biosynthesis protein PelG
MAGIGFSLDKLMRADKLGSNTRGLLHAAMIAAGPWLLVCLTLSFMQLLGRGLVSDVALIRFGATAMHAFGWSIVVASPVVLVLARCLADAVHARDVRSVLPMMFAGVAAVAAVLTVVGALVFGLWLDLPWGERVLGHLLLVASGALWVAASIMTALRSYTTVSWAFVGGMAVACTIAWFTVGSLRAAGLLLGLVAGVATVLAVIAARIVAEFSLARGKGVAFSLREAFARHRALAWAGLFYGAGLWVDKALMWSAPGTYEVGRGLWSNATYEGAVFFAFLTVVPVMALFLVDVETRFHKHYQRYFHDIDARGTLRHIRRNHGALLRTAGEQLSRLATIQAVVAIVAILAAPAIVPWVGGGIEFAPVFRFAVVGAAFHVLFVIALAALAYFDQRRKLVIATLVFFVLNAVLTLVTIRLGDAFHGWGYAAAALAGFAVAFHGAATALAKLPYMTFVATNPAVRDAPTVVEAGKVRARRGASALAQGATAKG